VKRLHRGKSIKKEATLIEPIENYGRQDQRRPDY
jgi:hypothetical protein